MFCGEFQHALDEKNRLVVPSKFRTFIRTEEDKEGFFLLASPARDERCLRLYTSTAWRRQVDVIRGEAEQSDNPAEFYRLYASHAEFVQADTQGRVVLPQRRLDEMRISREILLVGNFDWIEVWDPAEYRTAQEQLRKKYADRLTRSLWTGGAPAAAGGSERVSGKEGA